MQQCFATNVSGPAVMIETFSPLLQKSRTTPRIVNVSSGSASLERTVNPRTGDGPLIIPYKTSKAAFNMMSVVEFAKFRQAKLDVKVFTYCPGYRVSNLSRFNTAENGAKPAVDGARPMVAMLNGERDGDVGLFLNSDDGQHPW